MRSEPAQLRRLRRRYWSDLLKTHPDRPDLTRTYVYDCVNTAPRLRQSPQSSSLPASRAEVPGDPPALCCPIFTTTPPQLVWDPTHAQTPNARPVRPRFQILGVGGVPCRSSRHTSVKTQTANPSKATPRLCQSSQSSRCSSIGC